MKIFTNIVLFAILVLGGFWIGMEWGSASQKQTRVPPRATPVVQQPSMPEAPTETIVPEPVIAEPTEEKTVETLPATESILTKILPSEEVIRYENARFKYGFDISKKVYYSGFGAQGGASHTVGINKTGMPETFTDASVRVYFYRDQILPELQNAQSPYQDPAGGFIMLLLDGKHSVKIEAADLQNPIVTRVAQSITVK